MNVPGACSPRSLERAGQENDRPTRVDGRYRCATDDAHGELAMWLEWELGHSGYAYDSGSLIEELFDEIGAVRSGKQESAVACADLARVTIDRTGCAIELMPSMVRCSLTVEELVDAVLEWFDVVNPQLASAL